MSTSAPPPSMSGAPPRSRRVHPSPRAAPRALPLDDEEAFLPDQPGGVAAGPDQHVDVVAHLDGVALDVVAVLLQGDGAARHGEGGARRDRGRDH